MPLKILFHSYYLQSGQILLHHHRQHKRKGWTLTIAFRLTGDASAHLFGHFVGDVEAGAGDVDAVGVVITAKLLEEGAYDLLNQGCAALGLLFNLR